MIQNVVILGAGSAGLIAAITLQRKLPQCNVRIVRSPEIGVIGVGEGTTPNFPRHLFHYCGVDRARFYQRAEPVWKLGIRFLWGPRERFDFTFSPQLDAQWGDLPRPHGYYCDEEFRCTGLDAALMEKGKVFVRNPQGGGPVMQDSHGFHIENQKLVGALEIEAREAGVEFTDAIVRGVERGPQGIAAVFLEDGRRIEADLFVDASGFRSELLGKALAEPFLSFDRALFCDRAVVGGWERTAEPIQAYTTAETMDAGWAWQIEHEHHINRGYVYASQSISDDEACAEFLAKNPQAPKSPRVVKFRSGRHQRMWVDNVVAIGNSGGFVEPLQATALMVVCSLSEILTEILRQTGIDPTPQARALYNDMASATWDDIRDFLALHYKLNTRLDTPFWRHCREDTDLGELPALLDFYRESGPTGLNRYRLRRPQNNFGVEGYLVMLVGNAYPYRGWHQVTPQERATWNRHRADYESQALAGLDVAQSLACIRHPRWRWKSGA